MVGPDEAFQVLLEVARVLEDLNVPYLVGGSLASSLHGIPRSTQDADLVAVLRPEHILPFVGRVQGESLELSYLTQWAERSGTGDLLAEALTDAGMSQV